MSRVRPVSWGHLPVVVLILLSTGIGVARSENQEFRLLRFEKEIGSESFSVNPAPQGDGLAVTASARMEIAGRTMTMTQLLTVEEGSFALRDYRLTTDTQGEEQSISAKRTADSVIVEISAAGTSLHRPFPARGEVLILDNLMVNHLALIAMRAAQSGFRPETLQVVVPQVGALMRASIVPQTPAADGSRTVEVRIASVTEVIRFGPMGQIEGAAIPSQGLRYERAAPGGQAPREMPAPPRVEPDRSAPEAASTPTRTLFEEREVTFRSKDTDLSGLLTFPRAGQRIPYPAVLLVPREGAQDRDESIGPNRPLYEIARGLAVLGIASFRFDTRALSAPQTIRPLHSTVQEEVIDDALAALDYLRSQATIDSRRIWILGHGLGGSLAPTLARMDRDVAGLIILGGSLRPLDAILRDRLAAAGSSARGSGFSSPGGEADLSHALAMLDSLAAGTLPEKRVIQGRSAHYLLDYRARDLAGDFAAFKGPVLLLFGGKDDQINQADKSSWGDVAVQRGMKNVTSCTIAGVGHLFMPIKGDPSPENLTTPGHVDPAVIDQIGSFILTPP